MREVVRMMQGEKTYLRPLAAEDLECLYQWYNDPEFIYWLSGGWPFITMLSMDEIESKLLDDEHTHRYAILDSEQRLIGTTGFCEINFSARSAKLFIGIGVKSLWGKGLGSDALNTLIRYLFQQWNFNRLQLETWDGNIRAIKAYEKLGFKIEGRLRQSYYVNGEYRDGIVLGLLKNEWLNKSNS